MKQAHRQLFGDINITPLTDIFLVLLIIMMVVAPLLEYRGLDLVVAAPASSAPKKMTKEEKNKRLWVSIAADDQYTVDNAAVGGDDLVSAIRDKAPEKPDGVVIEVDPESNHAALAHAIDATQAAGVTALSVIEKEPPAKK